MNTQDITWAVAAFSVGAFLMSAVSYHELNARKTERLLNRQTYQLEYPECTTDSECEWKYGSPDQIITERMMK